MSRSIFFKRLDSLRPSGVSAHRFCAMNGIPDSRYSDWKMGREPSKKWLEKLSAIFHLPVDWFLGGSAIPAIGTFYSSGRMSGMKYESRVYAYILEIVGIDLADVFTDSQQINHCRDVYKASSGT